MDGQTIKAILKKHNHKLKDIAEIMGISLQNFASLLSSSDVKSGTLERIALAINKPLSFFYGESFGSCSNTITGSNNTAVSGNSNVLNGNATDILRSQLDEKDSQIRKSQEQIDRLLSIIEKKQ